MTPPLEFQHAGFQDAAIRTPPPTGHDAIAACIRVIRRHAPEADRGQILTVLGLTPDPKPPHDPATDLIPNTELLALIREWTTAGRTKTDLARAAGVSLSVVMQARRNETCLRATLKAVRDAVDSLDREAAS
jgi:hypothetical protein